jgi:PDZ domain
LVDLALQAARSMHKLRGFEYDESNEINIASDIRFSVVDLSLPLGLIFQENETGCWVTKVLPDGSAAKCQFIEVGDQLAAIDGVSAIKMSVDDIAGLIRRKSSEIELTFLRYVGPWRPAEGTVAEEGYEVRMQTRRENPMHLPGCGLTGSSKKAVVTSTTPPTKPVANKALRTSASNLRTSSRSNPPRSLSPTGRAVAKQSSTRNAAVTQQPQQRQSTTKKGFWRFGKKK